MSDDERDELNWIRRRLDKLAALRLNRAFGHGDAAHYKALTRREEELLRAGGDAAPLRATGERAPAN